MYMYACTYTRAAPLRNSSSNVYDTLRADLTSQKKKAAMMNTTDLK